VIRILVVAAGALVVIVAGVVVVVVTVVTVVVVVAAGVVTATIWNVKIWLAPWRLAKNTFGPKNCSAETIPENSAVLLVDSVFPTCNKNNE
jgi:hypothetical protein